MAEVKRLFDFLEFRALYDRLRTVLRTLNGPDGAGDDVVEDTANTIEAEVTRADTAAEVLEALAGCSTLDLAGAWEGQSGRSPLTGIAVVTDPSLAGVTWVPARLLTDPGVVATLTDGRPIRAHDAKPLMRSLLALGVDLRSLALDTAIAGYLLDPAEGRYAVGDLLTRYTGESLPCESAPSGQLNFDDDAVDESLNAARAAFAVARLAPAIESALEAQGMAALYRDIENPLVRVLAKMEHAGVAVDVAELRALNQRFTSECQRLMAEVHHVAGREFNVNSTIQLREILFEERKLAPVKKTKTGFSTDAQSLEKLRDQWPEFINPLLEYREFEKLRSTYGEGLLSEVAPDGRIHATFNQTVARTGRLSSDQPNLHNIPVRSEEGRQFRKAFVASPGNVLLIADYNQIELRCIAHLAEDPGLIDAFTGGEDIHNATAARVFGVDPKSVTLEQRSKAKMVSYGLAYGMEAYGLAQRLNIPRGEAADILNAYFAAFPNVNAYMDQTVKQAKARGYTETLFGRRRPIPDLQSGNFSVRAAAERQAMNAGIQGLAADIFKVALVRLDRAIEEAGLRSYVVLQVHDEILVESPQDEQDRVRAVIIETMRGAAQLRVPLEVNMSSGRTWAAAKG
jgi:DNA polymerase-1